MRQCRFCLDDQETPDNAMIEPCACRGSVQYVHRMCLRRWAQMDEANSFRCSICATLFTVDILPKKELLPTDKTISIFILDHTMVAGTALQYVLMCTSIYRPLDSTRTAHALFQLVILACFIKNHYVQNTELYRQRMLRGYFPYIAVLYLYILQQLVIQKDTVQCFFINLVANFFWREHIRVLNEMNTILDRVP